MPIPAVLAQIAIARWRSTGSVNTFVMIESVAGKISAAPTPVIARIAISAVAESTTADAAQPKPNTRSPRARIRRRPKRSPRLPQVSSSPANTTV